MPARNAAIDIIAYDPDGNVVLLAETRSRHGTSEVWAAKYRQNMLSDRGLPPAKYLLIATPERIYGWRQENLTSIEALPQFTVDSRKALARYFTQFKQDPASVSPDALQILVATWLMDISGSRDNWADGDPDLRSLSESGLLASLQRAQIEMNAAG